MTSLLLKALKYSILPAATMIVTKLLGIYFTARYFGYAPEIGFDKQGPFSIQLFFDNNEMTTKVNSYSDLLMFVSLFIIIIYINFRLRLLDSAQHNPKTIVKLTKLNLLKWVTDKSNNFLRMLIWNIYSLIGSLIVIVNFLADETYKWIGYLAIIACGCTIYITFKFFEEQLNKLYPDR